MVYQSFLTTITHTLQEEFGDLYQISIQKITKNNGTILDGLCISKEEDPISPTIYLNPYYERYLDGMPLDDIFTEIMDLYINHTHIPPIAPEYLNSFSQVQDKVIYRLIHTASNESLLSSVPHIPFLDLSITFCLFLEEQESCHMTAIIHDHLSAAWNVTVQDLYQLACKNTPRLLPVSLKEINQILLDISKEHLDNPDIQLFMEEMLQEQQVSPLYVLSNSSGIHGACAMLYDKVLKNFADTLEQDLIILPSSIHEVLLLPLEESTDFQELSEMVVQINLAEVPPEDRLSNGIYLYSRSEDHVTIASSSSSLLS